MSIQASIQALYQCLRNLRGDEESEVSLNVYVTGDDETEPECEALETSENVKTWEHPYYGDVTAFVDESLLADPKINELQTIASLLKLENELAHRVMLDSDSEEVVRMYAALAFVSSYKINESFIRNAAVTYVELDSFRNMCCFYMYNRPGVARSVTGLNIRDWVQIAITTYLHFGIEAERVIIVEIGNGLRLAFRLDPETHSYPEFIIVYRDWCHCALLSMDVAGRNRNLPEPIKDAVRFSRAFKAFMETYNRANSVSEAIEFDGNKFYELPSVIRRQKKPFVINRRIMGFGDSTNAVVLMRVTEDGFRFAWFNEDGVTMDDNERFDWDAMVEFIETHRETLNDKPVAKHLN